MQKVRGEVFNFLQPFSGTYMEAKISLLIVALISSTN